MNNQRIFNVFVYGTLREEGVAATHILSGFAMYDYGNFPYIMPDAEREVVGNIMYVSNIGLQKLDVIEGVAKGLYKREEVAVVSLATNKRERCFVYVGDKIASPRIISGDWFLR